MQLARSAFAYLAWLFIGLLTVQVFLAGVGLFGAARMSLHVDFGFSLPFVPLIILLAAAIGRVGSRLIAMSVLLLLLTILQTLLPSLRGGLPFIAALHPVNALALIWLTATIARRASALRRQTASTEEPVTVHGPSHEGVR